MAAALWSSATKHLHTAFRDRTQVSYYCAQFRLFIALFVYLSVSDFTSLPFVLMFVKYFQGLKYPTVLNYVSVLRHYFTYYSLPLHNVNHKKVEMLLKAIAMNATYIPRFKGIITIPILKNIVIQCNHFKHGIIFQSIFIKYPAFPDSPAFIVPRGGRYVPLLAFTVRQTLAKIIMALLMKPSAFTFHAFRRSGATFSFNNNVAFEDIRLQGSWKSDAIYTYLQSTNAARKVASSFQTSLQNS